MKRFTIALSGLDESDAVTFTQALGAMRDHAWQLVERPPCALLVVDIDTIWGHMDWLRATATGQQVITYTHDAQVRGHALVLHKPLRVDKLIALLQTFSDANDDDVAAATMAPTPVAPAVAVAEPEPEAMAERTPERISEPTPTAEPTTPAPASPDHEPLPANMTLGECLLAERLTAPVAITQVDGMELVLDPERRGYAGPSTLKPLKALLDTPMAQVKPLDRHAIERMRDAPSLPLARLLWFAALTSTPGQLSPALDTQARYRLTRWPQIEREFPRHFRIATAMMKDARSLGDIASAANAPIADVTDFINAYSVTGYVIGEGGSNDDSAQGGMFARLRKPFSRSAQETA